MFLLRYYNSLILKSNAFFIGKRTPKLAVMSGLVKQKEYDWKDSNVAKLGSSEDREVSCQCLFKLRRNIDIFSEVWCNLKNFEQNL